VTASERAYRVLLRVYPRPFRARYEDEMVRLFRDQMRDARESERRGALAAHWLHALTDIATSAPTEHLQPQEATVAKTVDSSSVEVPVSSGRGGRFTLGYALASSPFVVLLVVRLFAGEALDTIFMNPPSILGLPAGIVALFAASVWASLAFVGIRMSRSRIGITLSLLIFTVPALLVIVSLPAAIRFALDASV
jgi:hypothetical protein